jgi:hypothetical protein
MTFIRENITKQQLSNHDSTSPFAKLVFKQEFIGKTYTWEEFKELFKNGLNL